MTIKGTITWILVLGFIVLLLSVLWAIVRFSVLSPKKTKGLGNRLRNPDPTGINAICGFEPPVELLEFYRSAKYIMRTEFYLVDKSQIPPKGWFIGSFFPFSAIDVKENRIISNIPGIPIADNMDKGVYYVSESGPVVLDSPNIQGRKIVVASSVSVLGSFEPHESWDS